jgi:sigma-B regulation protein RsbU (phosphoserine phosphatase)
VKPISPDELRVRVRAGERVLELERRLAERNQQLEHANERLTAAYQRIEEDISAAAGVQASLLPPPELRTLGVACNWCFRPSSYMSGDIFNFFAVDDRHVGFYLLDVSGHGVPAAMTSVALSMVLTPDGTQDGLLKKYDAASGTFKVARPEEVMSVLNRRFQTHDHRHFTMSYGLLDLEASVLRLAQAGNPNPLLVHAEGGVKSLTHGGMPVGLWPQMDFDCIEVPFLQGDRLVLYSDGVSECTNPNGVEFGDERLVAYLKDAAHQPLPALLNGLERHLEAWRGSTAFNDDVSLLAIELIGEEK